MQHDWNKYFDTESEYWIKIQKIYDENEKYPKIIVSGRNLHHKFLRSFSKIEKEPIDNDLDNLVSLDIADHYLIHYYLWKCTKKGYRRQTAMSFKCMNETAQKYITDDIVELLAIEYKKAIQEISFSESHKRNISKALKGKKKSKEHIQHIKDTFKNGRKPSMLGKHVSEENKRKLSEARKGKHRPKHVIDALVACHTKKVICIETGKIFNSTVEASLYLGLNRNAVACAIHNNYRAGGYYWKYLEEENKDDK